MLTHLSLFTGIGGIDLAAEAAGFTTVCQVEIDDYCNLVLAKHWPNVPRWRDVRSVTGDAIRAAGITHVDLLSGGPPCQPASVAGKRKGTDDERWLWDEYFRIVGEVRPTWLLAENVPGLLSVDFGRAFGELLGAVAAMGYRVGWCTYGACDVGAPHRRERVFLVAHSRKERTERSWESKVRGIRGIPWCEDSGRSSEWSERSHLFTPKLCRTYHGIPFGVERVGACGNAVVPAQAYPILKAIAYQLTGGNQHGHA